MRQGLHISGDNIQGWYKDGLLHREDGPAVIDNNGNQFWFQYGKNHREDGPAVKYVSGNQYWFKWGKLHREDGPAVTNSNGQNRWYLNDTYISNTESEFKKYLIQQNLEFII